MALKKCFLWGGALVVITVAISMTLYLVLPGSNDGAKGTENPGNGSHGSNETNGESNNGTENGGNASNEENESGGEDNIKAFPRTLVIKSGSCILTGMDVDNLSNRTFVHEDSSFGTGCQFDLYLRDSIFYNDHPESIKSTSDKYPEMAIPANYYTSGFKQSWYTLAVDFVNKKVYAISTQKSGEAYKLFVLDILKQHYAIVLTDLYAPTDLVLDPAVGLLFISQQSSILRASMDGSLPTTILNRPDLAPVVSLDSSTQRIYWATQSAIESVDYAGNDRRAVVKISTSPPTDLASIGNRIFWLTAVSASSNKKTLWTCQTKGLSGACDSAKDLQLADDYNVGQIKAYDFQELYSVVRTKSNPCRKDNGGCEQLCLLSNSSSEGYSCACELGQKLKEDQKSCTGTIGQGFLMYVQGLFFRSRMMDHLGIKDEESRFGEAIYPVDVFTGPLNKAKVIHFAHDVREHLAYYVDDEDVRELSLVEIRKKPFIIDSTSDSEIYIATDWVSKTIYFSMSSFEDWRRKNSLRVYPYGYFSNNRYYKSLASYNDQYRIRNVVVHPNRGYVFYILTELNSDTSRLVRINSDGSDKQDFLENRRVREIGLSIDFLEDRLCWFSEDGTKLEYVKIDGSIDSLRSIDISMVSAPQTMTFDKSFAYVSNWANVWRLDKATGASAERLKHVNPESREMLSGVSYHSPEAQPLIDNHPCAVNKGGCRRFCFAVPDSKEPVGLKKQCGCYDDETLQPDGRTCV
ncbi:low-density lipoprotein receptor-related protein-like [Nasonia vitripennis]|uniref:Uncharacterized protein n=1 Tax=Nasonia vitripennis TaxID=7425 RepID=A0A7M7IVW9_NASVI|nr:low-density lipoprotein receptor-related protein-like [Nasonia vitripennis]